MTARKPSRLSPLERLAKIASIIEGVDRRCMAADGPVTPTLQEMTWAEIIEIYELARAPRRRSEEGEAMNQRTDDKLPRLLAGLRELEKAVPEYDTLIRAAIEELEAPPAATGATPRVDKVAHGCMECGDRVDADLARQLERELEAKEALIRRLQEGCDNYENERRLRREAESELAEANLTIRYERDRNLQKVQEARLSSTGAPQSSVGAPFSREDAAKIVERKVQELVDDPDNGYVDGDTNAFIWTNKEAEWQAILLDELAEEFRAATGDGAKR